MYLSTLREVLSKKGKLRGFLRKDVKFREVRFLGKKVVCSGRF